MATRTTIAIDNPPERLEPVADGKVAAHTAAPGQNLLRTVLSSNLQSLALLPVIVAVCILGTVTSPFFLTSSNLINNVDRKSVV